MSMSAQILLIIDIFWNYASMINSIQNIWYVLCFNNLSKKNGNYRLNH